MRYSPEALRELCVEVVFPVDAGFRVLRQGAGIDLLPRDAYFESVVGQIRAWVGVGDARAIDDATGDAILCSLPY